MSAKIMNVLNIKEYFSDEIDKLYLATQGSTNPPSLLIIDPTEGDPANKIYIQNKVKDFNKLYWNCHVKQVNNTFQLKKALSYGKELGLYNSIIVQLPAKQGIEFDPSWVPADLDVDGLNKSSSIVSATARGIIDYLDACGFEYEGKNAVILGRSIIAGKPIAKQLLNKNMTTSICHSYTAIETRDRLLKDADLVIAAVGKPGLIDRSLCPRAFVVDVGINRVDGKLVGDFVENPALFSEGVSPSSPSSTPVPGGVGLLTRLGLLKNCYENSLCKNTK